MIDRILSPSKITAWLDCSHYLTLQEETAAGLLRRRPGAFWETSPGS